MLPNTCDKNLAGDSLLTNRLHLSGFWDFQELGLVVMSQPVVPIQNLSAYNKMTVTNVKFYQKQSSSYPIHLSNNGVERSDIPLA